MNRLAATATTATSATLACLAVLLTLAAPAEAQPLPPLNPLDPATAVNAGDIVRLLGGNWKSRTPKRGAIVYTELGGQREIHIQLTPTDGRTIASHKQSLIANGEPFEDVPGLGTAALYRPESNQADVEIARPAAAAGPVWLSVVLYNVSDRKATKKAVLALARKAEGRL
jgi:hypothetical protein